AYAARSDEQSDDDQHDAVHDSTAKQSNNACYHENDRDQPEYELHASISLKDPRPPAADARNSRPVRSSNGMRCIVVAHELVDVDAYPFGWFESHPHALSSMPSRS